MTPLSDALTAAQRSALAALEKAYVAGQFDPGPNVPEGIDRQDLFAARLAEFGITDTVDVTFLCASLDVLREWGVSAPTMTERVARENGDAPKMMSDGQAKFIRDLLKRNNLPLLEQHEYAGLTFEQASEMIDTLKDGTYDPAKWSVPF